MLCCFSFSHWNPWHPTRPCARGTYRGNPLSLILPKPKTKQNNKITLRTGYTIQDAAAGGEDSALVEYDPWKVAVNYLRTWLVLDVISGVPFTLLELLSTDGSNADALKSAKILKIFRFLKLGRLLKLEKILTNLDSDTKDMIEDFFQVGA